MNNRFDNSHLVDIYRRFTRRSASRPLPDVDALLALADGERSGDSARTLSDVAQSGLHADLLRFSRALAPESARLGMALERELESAAHRQSGRGHRRAGERRVLRRIAVGLAACLVVVSAVWLVRPHQTSAPAATVATRSQAPSDRIFAALDAPAPRPGRDQRDQIFRASFVRDRDRIFKAPFNG